MGAHLPDASSIISGLCCGCKMLKPHAHLPDASSTISGLCCGCRYPVPPRPETIGRTEVYIGNWMKARGCRDK
eukprot:scaffold229211_cov17-Tisochrysis_lutea.AAC.1